MDYKIEKSGNILVVGIFGELDHHKAAPLREAIDSEMMSARTKDIIIDLSGLELMDSSGIGVIMGRLRLVDSLGGVLCVSGASPSVQKIIELSGLTNLVFLCDTAEKAVKILKGEK